MVDVYLSSVPLDETSSREFLLQEIASSYIWLNLYNNSTLLNALIATAFDANYLDYHDLSYLSKVHFLVKCAELNFCRKAARILESFAFELKLEQNIVHSIINGSVNWGATFQQRIASGLTDRTLFVTSNTAKDNDTSVNQLLKFILAQIVQISREILHTTPRETVVKETWYNIVIKQYNEAEKLMHHIKLKNVTLPSRIKYGSILDAANSRNQYYREISSIGKLFYDLFVKRSMRAIKDLVLSQVLAPVDTPTVFEFAVLFKVLNYFESQMKKGDTKHFSVIRTSKQTIFEYSLSGVSYKIFYQSLPDSMISREYSSSLKNQGYAKSSLRPDIIIQCDNTESGLSYTRIVEIKYSLRPAYTYEGMKDVLAYLYDFPCVDDRDDCCAMLVTYLPRPIDERSGKNKVWICGYSQLYDDIKELINR